jgi:hypothetical protein
MHLTNFNIAEDFIALEQGESYFDLHNNFAFIGFSYNTSLQELTFQWQRRNEKWVAPNDPKELELKFCDVSLFKAKERDADESYTEDDCLCNLGFIYNNLLDELEGFRLAKPNDDVSHLNICFQSGFAVKIAAGTATLNISESV